MKITNTIKITKLLAILFISVFTFTACSDDDDDHDHDSEEELITTVKYTLTNDSDVVILKFSDPDGEDGNDGTYSPSEPLTANTTYTGVVELLNETESIAEDITKEVKEEGDEHEFFYTSSGLTITKTDVDGNDNPLGIETSVTTGEAGSGTLTIVLKHQPTKPNDGSSSSAGGSTDVEVTFNVTIN
jgi:hypothetical protein